MQMLSLHVQTWCDLRTILCVIYLLQVTFHSVILYEILLLGEGVLTLHPSLLNRKSLIVNRKFPSPTVKMSHSDSA